MQRDAILLAGNYSNRTGYAWANIYRLFDVIAHEMNACGIAVCLSFAKIEPPIEVISGDIPFSCMEFDPHRPSFRSLTSLIWFIRKHRVRYVYLTDQASFRWLYLLLRAAGVTKVLVHSRISVPDPNPARPETGLRRIIKLLVHRLGWLMPDRIYAVSDFVRNRLVSKNCIPEAKVVKILNGIDIDRFSCNGPTSGGDRIVIFAGGRASPHKGIDVLVRAAHWLVKRHGLENFVIEYAGDGPQRAELEAMVEEFALRGRFLFLGKLGSTRDAVCRSDIVAVPSKWGDACPSSVSEALAAGKPLVATAAGGIPELIGDRGNAVLVPPSDAVALADALATLITDRKSRAEMGRRAKERAENALDEKSYHRAVLDQMRADLGISAGA